MHGDAHWWRVVIFAFLVPGGCWCFLWCCLPVPRLLPLYGASVSTAPTEFRLTWQTLPCSFVFFGLFLQHFERSTHMFSYLCRGAREGAACIVGRHSVLLLCPSRGACCKAQPVASLSLTVLWKRGVLAAHCSLTTPVLSLGSPPATGSHPPGTPLPPGHQPDAFRLRPTARAV